MTKFYGEVGYAILKEETPGKWVENIETQPYYGDVVRNNRRLDITDQVNDGIIVNNSISILADAYAYENMFAIRYVTWMGTKWKVTNVEPQRPRLILTLGGVYNEK